MANFINYADIAPQNLQSGLPDIFKNALQGYQIAKAPGDMAIGRQKSIADAMLEGLKAQAYPEQNRADIAYKQSETYKNMHPEQYFAPQGPAAEVLARQRAVQQFGEDSNEVKQIDALVDLNRRAKESTIARNDALTGSQAVRNLTQSGKLEAELQDVKDGFMPGTSRTQPIQDAETQQKMLAGYDNKIAKNNLTANLLNKNLQATQLMTALDSINIDDLVAYSGKGALDRFGNEILSPGGKESEAYRKYKAAATKAKISAEQITKYLGSTIDVKAQEALNKLTDPSSLYNSPETARAIFNALKEVMSAEVENTRKAANSVSAYGMTPSSPTKKVGGRVQVEFPSPTNEYRTYNPKTGRIE